MFIRYPLRFIGLLLAIAILAAAASLEKGILAPAAEEQKLYLDAWDAYTRTDKVVVKFVPASGAASRMFKNLFEFLGADYDVPETKFEKTFFEQIEKFAFYNDLNAACEKAFEKNIRKVEPYVPGEQPKKANVIKLNTNENPYPPSPKVKEQCAKICAETEELRLYPDPTAGMLVEAIAKYKGLDSSQVFVGVGSDDVLAMAFLTFFNSERPIFFPDITYSFYDVWADLFKIPYDKKPLDENFMIKKDDYYWKNGGVVFPNPNAPTGVLMPLDEIEDIISHNQDVIVIVDEAYVDFGGSYTTKGLN